MSSDVPLPEGWTKNVSKSTGTDKSSYFIFYGIIILISKP